MITFHRKHGIVKLVCSGSESNCLSDRSAPKEAPKNIKATASYSPLQKALGYRWTGLTKRQTKEVKPVIIFTILGLCQLSG
jgi:hypothetical protein